MGDAKEGDHATPLQVTNCPGATARHCLATGLPYPEYEEDTYQCQADGLTRKSAVQGRRGGISPPLYYRPPTADL